MDQAIAQPASRPTGAGRALPVAGGPASRWLGVPDRPHGDRASRGSRGAAQARRTVPVNPAIEAKWGVRVSRVAVTADGGIVDMRFVVLDPDKALAMMQDLKNLPILHPAGSGVVIGSVAQMSARHDLDPGPDLLPPLPQHGRRPWCRRPPRDDCLRRPGAAACRFAVRPGQTPGPRRRKSPAAARAPRPAAGGSPSSRRPSSLRCSCSRSSAPARRRRTPRSSPPTPSTGPRWSWPRRGSASSFSEPVAVDLVTVDVVDGTGARTARDVSRADPPTAAAVLVASRSSVPAPTSSPGGPSTTWTSTSPRGRSSSASRPGPRPRRRRSDRPAGSRRGARPLAGHGGAVADGGVTRRARDGAPAPRGALPAGPGSGRGAAGPGGAPPALARALTRRAVGCSWPRSPACSAPG